MNQEDLDFDQPMPRVPGSYFDLLLTARELAERGQWEEAKSVLERIIDRLSRLPASRRRPDSLQAQYLVAAAAHLQNIHVKLGEFQAAEALCRLAQAWDPLDPDYWQVRLHGLKIRQGQVDEGLQGLQAMAEAAPEDFSRWITLAQEAVDVERADLASTAVAHAERLMADMEDEDAELAVLLVYYDLYRLRGEWRQARKAWEEAEYLDPELDVSREMVMRQFLAAGQWDEAQQLIDEDSLSEPIADYYRAYIAHRRGDQVRARHLWRQVVDADPEIDPGIEAAQAIAHCYLGQPLRALDLLLSDVQTSKQLSPRKALTLALAWAMQGDREAALADMALARQVSASRRQEHQWSALDWYEFQVLVEDPALREELRAHFQVEKD